MYERYAPIRSLRVHKCLPKEVCLCVGQEVLAINRCACREHLDQHVRGGGGQSNSLKEIVRLRACAC